MPQSERAGAATLPGRAGPGDGTYTLLAILAGAALYAWHAAPTVQYWDAGERALVAWELGVSHPTGCVLHAVLGRGFIEITPLWPDHAANLLSAFLAALALGIAYRIGRLYSEKRALCFAATLVLGSSSIYWSQAVYSEVYAPHYFFFAAFMFYFLRWLRDLDRRDLVIAAFVYAVGLGVHMSHVLLAPWMLIAVLTRDRSVFRSPRTLAAIGGAGLLGLSWIAALVIRGQTYWMIGTLERPDSLGGLLDFLSGAQFAWARHPPAAILAKRIIGCVAFLFYSFLGVGVVVALWGWLCSLRKYPGLAILAAGGTITYILYFSDNSSSDVGTLILPCTIFVFIYFIEGWQHLTDRLGGRQLTLIVFGLAACQWIVFPVLGRAGERFDRRISETGVILDEAGTAGALFWEGVLKGQVSYRCDGEPFIQSWRLRNTLERWPGRKAFIVPWEVQTVLVFFKSTDEWFEDARMYETMDQPRFYPPETGSVEEIVDHWHEVAPKYAGTRPVLFLARNRNLAADIPHRFHGRFWFDKQFFYLYELGPVGVPDR